TVSTALGTASPAVSMPASPATSASGAYGGWRSGGGWSATPPPAVLLRAPDPTSRLSIDDLSQELEVLPRRAHPLRAAQEVRGMIRHHDRDASPPVDATAQRGDAVGLAHQRLRRERADREQRTRRDQLDLLLEERRAGCDLVRLRIPVPRRAALEHVADVDPLTREARARQEPVEQLPGRPDERPAAPVLFRSRRLADHHDLRARRALAEDDRATARMQPAAGARERSGPHALQRRGRRGRRWSGPGRCRRRTRRVGHRRAPAPRRQRERLSTRQRLQEQGVFPELAALAQVPGQQLPDGAHGRGPSRAATRSSSASATSCLDMSGSASSPPLRSRITTRFVSTSNPAPGSVASFNTMRSSPFASSFARALLSASWVSRAKPTVTRPAGRASSVERSTSGAGSSAIAPGASFRLIFRSAARTGRKSATAAAMISTAAVGNAPRTALAISSAVSTRTTSTPTGGSSAEGPVMRMTRAPRRQAEPAIAYPIRPDDRFERNRTGSTGSRVGPAVTTTVRP